MTFCASDCVETLCYRFWSEEEKKKAVEWWGSEDVPVAFSDFSKDCPMYKKNTDK